MTVGITICPTVSVGPQVSGCVGLLILPPHKHPCPVAGVDRGLDGDTPVAHQSHVGHESRLGHHVPKIVRLAVAVGRVVDHNSHLGCDIPERHVAQWETC